ncbi:MAG: hypothetical protein ACRC28_11755 [Clostridium sp.]|uniref:hypothetical protein n=1 Tax=Clostridium sp. TaxID=1506 RepID=UPI003F3F6DA3
MPIPFLLIGGLVAAGTAGVGAGAYGVKKMSDANNIIKDEKRKYDSKKNLFDKKNEECVKTLEDFTRLKLEIWKSFDRFSKTYEKIKNKPEFKGGIGKDKYRVSKLELENINEVKISALKILGASTLAVGTGGALAGGTIAGVGLFGVASTGTAISTLSGAAATNATLAAIGGGSLATGGLGMAGGTAILGGVVAAPALAIGGVFMAWKGNSSMEKAYEISAEVSKAVKQFNEGEIFLGNLQKIIKEVDVNLKRLYKYYLELIMRLEDVVKYKCDFRKFEENEKYLLEANIIIVKVLKKVTQINLITKNKEGKDIINSNKIKNELLECNKTII